MLLLLEVLIVECAPLCQYCQITVLKSNWMEASWLLWPHSCTSASSATSRTARWLQSKEWQIVAWCLYSVQHLNLLGLDSLVLKVNNNDASFIAKAWNCITHAVVKWVPTLWQVNLFFLCFSHGMTLKTAGAMTLCFFVSAREWLWELQALHADGTFRQSLCQEWHSSSQIWMSERQNTSQATPVIC